jgi:hypothetical protein
MYKVSPESSVLYSPQLPQMNDGKIDIADLTQLKGVLIVINASPDANKGDYLTLTWNGMQVGLLYIDSDNPASFFPWATIVPAELAPDGSYPVYYTRMDEASNIAVSDTVTALVRRNDTGTLQPPLFPEANTLNTITGDALSDGSTLVQIPAYPGMATDDKVFVYWVGMDSAGTVVSGSATTQTHTVTALEPGHSFTVPIAAPYVSVIGKGSASSWYVVQPAGGGNPESSDTATVLIDTSQSILPAPFFPEGNDGWIDSEEASDGTPVSVPAYPGIAIDDVVTVNWQGMVNNSPVTGTAWNIKRTISAADLATGFSVTVPASDIVPVQLGTGQAWYQVAFNDGNTGISTTAVVNIDTTHPLTLPAPVFPEAAGDNTLDNTEYADGTPMQVSYSPMTLGDSVTLYWQGYQRDGITPVPDTTWSRVHQVTAPEALAGLFTETVPALSISPIGNGKASASYTVFMAGGAGISHSLSTEVNIMSQAPSGLQINCATGAPVFDETILIRPVNIVTLAGPAGATIYLSLPAGSEAYFNPEGVQTLAITLNESGWGSTEVYCSSVGNILVSATDARDPLNSADESMIFTPWASGPGDLLSYGVSTAATADGLSHCGVYMLTADDSTASQARLDLSDTANAVITASGGTTAFVNVSTTHTARFDVTDTVSEPVSFTLSLLDTGAYVNGTLTFTPVLMDHSQA